MHMDTREGQVTAGMWAYVHTRLSCLIAAAACRQTAKQQIAKQQAEPGSVQAIHHVDARDIFGDLAEHAAAFVQHAGRAEAMPEEQR